MGPVPEDERQRVDDDGESGGCRKSADEKGNGRVFEDLDEIRGRDTRHAASEDEAADPVLNVDEERERERVGNPCRCDGDGDVHAGDVGDEARGEHLERGRHQCEEGPDGGTGGKPLAGGLPEFRGKQTVTEAAVEPCSADVFRAGEVSKESAEAAAAPLGRFHLLLGVVLIGLAK